MKAIIVEDEPHSLLLNQELLEKSGLIEVVATFTKPKEAIPAIIASQPDILFVDIEMPMMNGFQVIEEVAGHTPQMQVVIITSYEQYAVKAFEVEASDYLVKPLTEPQVKRMVARLKRIHQFNVSQRAAAKPIQHSNKIAIQVFDNFRITVNNQDIHIHWLSVKSEEVFLYLLLQRNYEASKDSILQAIWPDANEHAASLNLNTSIYRIKKSMQHAQLPIGISVVNGRYQLI